MPGADLIFLKFYILKNCRKGSGADYLCFLYER